MMRLEQGISSLRSERVMDSPGSGSRSTVTVTGRLGPLGCAPHLTSLTLSAMVSIHNVLIYAASYAILWTTNRVFERDRA